MDTTFLNINKDAKNVVEGLGINEPEYRDYMDRKIKPLHDSATFKIHDAIGDIWNDEQAPLNLRILGLVALGKIISSPSRICHDGEMPQMPPHLAKMMSILKMIEDLEK